MFDVIIFAAGRGSRMRELTDSVAKPSLYVGSETIIGRLVRQSLSLVGLGEIYINCSYQTPSIINAIGDEIYGDKIKFLWEKRTMGTAWSLLKIFEFSGRDILAIHGDLFIELCGLTKFQEMAHSLRGLSSIAGHRRANLQARSEILLNDDGLTVREFTEKSKNLTGSPHNIEQKEIWSNSGIYFFRSSHLLKLKQHNYTNLDIPSILIASLMNHQALAMLEFQGKRFSIENPEQLDKVRRLSPQFN